MVCGSIWNSGWEHYDAGGGVFVHSKLNAPEMSAAVADFQKLARWNPLSTKARNYEGKALIHLEKYEKALDAFDESLAIRSNFTAHYRRAYALMKLERFEEMREALLEAQKHETDFSRVVRFDEEFGHLANEPHLAGIQENKGR